jgi:hypothetical protein
MRAAATAASAALRGLRRGLPRILAAAILTGLLPCLLAGAGGAARADERAGPYDGVWDTVLSCANASGALGYAFKFPSIIKGDVLHGEHGTKDAPGWLTLDGRILADGSARLYADGIVGAAPFAVGQRPAGTQYGYHIDARFAGDAGSGHRVEGRPCTVTFTKRE